MRVVWIACVVLAGAFVHTASADPRQDRARAEQICAAREPGCDWLATLSSLERATVVRALTARGYELEAQPWGKTIGHVRVYNEDVFAEGTALIKFFNKFHVTTKENAVRQEVVVSPGEVWDQLRIDETARRLRDPLWTTVIVVLPVKSAEPGKVDALVVTRDIWSLRLNTNYTYQLGTLTNLSITLSENNFLGQRNVVALGLNMDQGAIATGPLFINKNVFGQHYVLAARVDAIYTRRALFDERVLNREGSRSSVTLTKELWRLSEKWGGNLSFAHSNSIARTFNGLDLRQLRCPLDGSRCFNPRATDPPPPDDEPLLPRTFSLRNWSASVEATRRWGAQWKQQVSIGQTVSNRRSAPLASFPGDDVQRASFIRDVLPRSELISAPFVQYTVFTPRFRMLRNINTYDLAEDVRYGPVLDTSLSFGTRLLGGDRNFLTGVLNLSYTMPWCRDGFVRTGVGIGGRAQTSGFTDDDTDGLRFIDNTASATLRAVSPTYGWARVVAEASFSTRWNDTQNSFFTLGGADNGLRGFQINELFGARTGDRRMLAQVEVRTVPRPIWVLRAGAVAFYEVGSVADTLRDVRLHHDVGVGLRMLIPQTSRELFRFDLAVPLDSTGATQAGQLRFTAGFDSAF
ncbi:MAG: BamA/TamA family outer membrane protein [Deltaproteobacteria bacterium]|nr:BamA/TamA family outer membrane protein [Deltaproteobacteria bacterium]